MSERILMAAAGGLMLVGATFAFRDSMPDGLRWMLFGKPSPAPVWRGPVRPFTPPPRPVEPKVTRTTAHVHAPRPIPRPIPVYDISVVIPPAPVASDIRPSMSMTDLLAKYGAPDVTAVWSNGGSLNQKLIYKSGSEALEVDVRNGSVTGSRAQIP